LSRHIVADVSRILVPVDGSDISFKAATYAINLAKLNKAKVICIHVIGPAPHLTKQGTLVVALPSSYYGEVKSQANEWFAKIKSVALKYDVEIELEVFIDTRSISAAILDYGKREDIELIVIGSRGMTGFKRLLLGSIAYAVVTYAGCSVIVMK
jgi:nucleotide-binding universal stress UspA family protein